MTRQVAAPDAEQRLSRLISAYVAAGRPGPRFFGERPDRLLAFLRDAGRLPVLRACPGASPEGRAIRRALERPTYLVRTPWQRVTAVLEVPEDPSTYPLGHQRNPLRRHVRIGDRLGLRWRRVDDPAERDALLTAADGLEAEQAQRAGRTFVSGNHDTVQYRMWLLAEDASGQPLQLSVAAVDGSWAALRYYRSMTEGSERSVARYWLMPHVVAALAAEGVRFLSDTVSPAALPNGLRHFQRDVGFRLADVRLGRERRDGRTAAVPASEALSAGGR